MAPRYSNSSGVILAVLYLRRSGDKQETSIEDQRSELMAYAAKHGYTIVGEYQETVSGDRTEERTEFLRMRNDCLSGKFEVVLCWDQDRFGRFDPLDAGYWIYPFRQAGARLETIAQGRIDWEDLTGQLIYSVNQLGKAQFLRDLSRNTVRGMLASARKGEAGTGGPSPYGYRSRKNEITKKSEVWIVSEEAEIVRLVFELFLAPGGSLRSVAGELNRRKIPTPGQAKDRKRAAKAWRVSSVRAILCRRKYCGTFVYMEQGSGKYFASQDGEIVPRRKSDKATKSDPIVHEKKFKKIVSQKTFDRAQAKLANNKTDTAPKQARQYLLSGLVRCGDCGGAMGGRTQSNGPVYRCQLYHQTGRSQCHCNTITEAPLLRCIVRKIQERYLSKPALDCLRQALEQEQNRTGPRPRDLKRLKTELDKLNRKIDNAEDSVLEAPPKLRPGLYRKLEELTGERDRLKSDLDAQASRERTSNGKAGKEIDQAIDALKNLGEALAKARPEETKELLSSIVSKIELNFEPGTGKRKRDFSHGTIYVRPDAGGNRSLAPQGTHLNNKGPLFGTPFTGHFLRRLTCVGRPHLLQLARIVRCSGCIDRGIQAGAVARRGEHHLSS